MHAAVVPLTWISRMHPALADALARRGRVWGDQNAARLRHMRDERLPGPAETGRGFKTTRAPLPYDDKIGSYLREAAPDRRSTAYMRRMKRDRQNYARRTKRATVWVAPALLRMGAAAVARAALGATVGLPHRLEP